jgi:hypothetical protein
LKDAEKLQKAAEVAALRAEKAAQAGTRRRAGRVGTRNQGAVVAPVPPSIGDEDGGAPVNPPAQLERPRPRPRPIPRTMRAELDEMGPVRRSTRRQVAG